MITPKPLPAQVIRSSGRFASTPSLLGVAFVILKLTHVIHWSWWLVLLPFYGPTAALLGITAVMFIVGSLFIGLAHILGGRK